MGAKYKVALHEVYLSGSVLCRKVHMITVGCHIHFIHCFVFLTRSVALPHSSFQKAFYLKRVY